MAPAPTARSAATGTTVGRAVIPQQNRQPVILLTGVLIMLIVLLALTRGWNPAPASQYSRGQPTPALPLPNSGPDAPLRPQIGINVLDQEIWDAMPVVPVMNWPSQANMWLTLPNDADYIVALVDRNNQWTLSVWHGPVSVPTGDATGVHSWQFPAGTPAEEVLNRRNALIEILNKQGRLRRPTPQH